MSVDRDPLEPGARDGAGELIARAAAADARGGERWSAIADDLRRTDDERLDDEVRAIVNDMLERLVGAVEADIRHHAERVLGASRRQELAPRQGLLQRLLSAGLVDDEPLLRELVARARMGIVALALTAGAPDQPERPSLTSRLATGPDRVVAAAATAMMIAEGRRSAPDDGRDDLLADHHHRIVWWVAAALRPSPANAVVDRALIEAAQRALAAHDEGARLEATAMRLAVALDTDPEDLPGVLLEALADRRLVLFIALIAHALGSEFDRARELVLDPAGDRLWLVLRALELDRASIARIGFALTDADRRRDSAGFADRLNAAIAVSPGAARDALAELRLPPDFRAAVLSLGRTR